MSHVVSIKTELKNRAAIEAACSRLNLPAPQEGQHSLFSSKNHRGLAVKLPGWNYPVVINEETGEVKYDNYNGQWGKQIELDKFVQAYTLEAGAAAARLQGYNCVEQELSDGSVRLTMTSY